MANSTSPPFIAGLSEIAAGYRVALCDIWGVIHNGVWSFPDACAAVTEFRKERGPVVLLTNAPRPSPQIVEQLDGLGVPRSAYSAVVTSGDVTRSLLSRYRGRPVYHLGHDRDLPLYEGLGLQLSSLAAAEVVSCTGPVDDVTETEADYEDELRGMAERGLPMICANPDIVVERGDQLITCAGALARRYVELGGSVAIAGKPHPAIYDEALAAAARIVGAPVGLGEVLAIGDGLMTDIAGASRHGIDALFVISGIHAAELSEGDAGAAIHGRLAAEGIAARALVPRLRW